jgi:hypothetical protein
MSYSLPGLGTCSGYFEDESWGKAGGGVIMRRLRSCSMQCLTPAALQFHERNLDADLSLALCLDLQVGECNSQPDVQKLIRLTHSVVPQPDWM